MADLTIGDLTFDENSVESKGDAVTDVEESGSVSAPTKKTESGFDFTTRVNREPREISVSVLMPNSRVSTLQSLRQNQTPVEASFGQIAMDKALVKSVSITDNSEQTSHVEASIELKEVQQFSTGTTTIVTAAGSSGAEDKEPTDKQPDGDTDDGDDAPDNNDDGGNVVSDALGAAADSITDFVGGIF